MCVARSGFGPDSSITTTTGFGESSIAWKSCWKSACARSGSGTSPGVVVSTLKVTA